MRVSKFAALLLASLALGACGPQGGQTEIKELTTDDQKGAYAIGLNIAGNLKGSGMDIDIDALTKGLRDGLAGTDSLMTETEMRDALQAFSTRAREASMKKQQEEGAANLKAGEDFLAENRGREGVQATASGLQYQILTEGSGAKPAATDRVRVHYRGTLLDGTQFDSSYDRGEPAEFPLSGVISGWTEGLQLMPVGSKYKFWIPAGMAYGEQGRPSIPPNSTLVFEVELLDILGPQAADQHGH